MRQLILLFIFPSLVGFISSSPNPAQPSSLEVKSSTSKSVKRSKRYLLKIYLNAGFDKTLYCGCRFNSEKYIDYSRCGYKPRKPSNKRSQRLEWEHLMPAFKFGKILQCWREPICKRSTGRAFGGRKCCSKNSSRFKQMESDMHNLFPAIGEINGDRSNYPFGEISGELRKYGQCDIEINRKLAEPDEKVRGDIARTYFYMSYQYKIPLLEKKEEMLRMWHVLDPPDTWEMNRNSLIEKKQGNRNPFIDNPELVERIRDF